MCVHNFYPQIIVIITVKHEFLYIIYPNYYFLQWIWYILRKSENFERWYIFDSFPKWSIPSLANIVWLFW